MNNSSLQGNLIKVWHLLDIIYLKLIFVRLIYIYKYLKIKFCELVSLNFYDDSFKINIQKEKKLLKDYSVCKNNGESLTRA